MTAVGLLLTTDCLVASAEINHALAAQMAQSSTIAEAPDASELQGHDRTIITVAQLGRGERRYKRPRYGLARLDWCRLWASECGAPAANAFCRYKGHAGGAVRWGKANNIGATERTIVIGTGDICDRPSCDGFTYIDCLHR